MQKSAIITGITGQDGAYLAKLLIKKKIKVFGIIRRISSNPFERINYFKLYDKIKFLNSDLSEFQKINSIISKIKPDYFFNLASQSFVTYSYENPIYTDNINNSAVINILEGIRLNSPKTRFYQASSSEMYGGTVDKLKKLDENSKFNPISPYAIAKLSAFYYTKLYRDSYKLHASNGILFNHESPLRGDQFVTKKIIKTLVEIIYGHKKKPLTLGNIYSRRDWGHAEEYVDMMFKIVKKNKPNDYVISSEKNYSIKDFINYSCEILGKKIYWSGKKLNEVAKDKNGKVIVKISKKFFRPQDVKNLLGDSTKAKTKLKWQAKKSIQDLIKDMIKYEINYINKK